MNDLYFSSMNIVEEGRYIPFLSQNHLVSYENVKQDLCLNRSC